MILIYSSPISNRVKYTFNLVFNQILGVEIEWTSDLSFFKNSILPKISYHFQPIQNEIHFHILPFLLENTISPQNIIVKKWHNLPAFFYHNQLNAALPFDPFAMIFYLVSRYEEYFAKDLDQHDRFKATASLAYQHDFLELPLVNNWAIEIKKIIQKHYPDFFFPTKKFQFTPTYDIDYAWSYLHKGWKRTIGGYAKMLLKNPKLLPQRIKVQLKLARDPYFTYDLLKDWHQTYQLAPIYFFLVGDYGEFDKNTSIHNKPFQSLIQQIEAENSIGLHPSYQSNQHIHILKKELKSLNAVANNSIIKSRQHFLKLALPSTYQNLIKVGIQTDYTMGYAENIGFRASIATPFYWFDLSENEITTLQIFPFQIMDVTLKNYLKLSPELATHATKRIIDNTKLVDGHFISLWHNNSFSEQEGWEGWRAVYEKMLINATS